MKLIIAYIQPVALKAVKAALFEREIYKMSVMTDVLGCGQQRISRKLSWAAKNSTSQ